jgi:hypothetical protein
VDSINYYGAAKDSHLRYPGSPLKQSASDGNPHGSRKFDEYGDLTINEERKHLDDFARELQGEPDMRGYIIAYGGRRSRVGEARARAERGEEILGALATQLARWSGEQRHVVIAAGGAAHAERLQALLAAHDVEVTLRLEPGTPQLLQDDPAPPALVVQVGEVSAGFVLPDEDGGLVLLGEQEIFGPRVRRAAPRSRSATSSSASGSNEPASSRKTRRFTSGSIPRRRRALRAPRAPRRDVPRRIPRAAPDEGSRSCPQQGMAAPGLVVTDF